MSHPLLVLRPEPEAHATAARAEALGMNALVRPLFGGVPVAWIPPAGAFDAVMMTSANAARFGGPDIARYRALPLYTVGAATAAAAQQAGFADIHAGSETVDAVLTRIAIEIPGRILYLAARDQTAHAEPLFEIVTVIVYAMEVLPPPGLPSGGVALIHSSRAGACFAGIVPDPAAFDIVAISEKAGEAVGTGWRSRQWPDVPTDAAMLALAAPLCEG